MTLLAINIPTNQQEDDVQLQVVQREAQACRERVAELVMKHALLCILHIYTYTQAHVQYRYETLMFSLL